jgi:hypothetical protein
MEVDVESPVELESGHAFRMSSPHDAFRKLHRELKRYTKPGADRADRKDAAINFAITAGHMTDWVWKIHEERLARDFGVACLISFQDVIKRKCRGLAACDVIANAAKHGGVAKQRPDRPDVVTVLVAHSVGEASGNVELAAVRQNRRWSLKIKVNGRPEHAGILFSSVTNFWHGFI